MASMILDFTPDAAPRRKKFADLSPECIGLQFGKLTVTGTALRSGRPNWICLCSCGKTKTIRSSFVRCGHTVSCGCAHAAGMERSVVTHGNSRVGKMTAEYICWRQMRIRCHKSSDKSFADYGGRGISVCPQWRESFSQFLADMGPRPSSDHSIERIDNSGNYKPSNCRWATRLEQCRNRRSNKMLTHNGKTQCMKDWAKELGVRIQLLHSRLKRGWSVADTLSKPSRVAGVTS